MDIIWYQTKEFNKKYYLKKKFKSQHGMNIKITQ